MFRVALSTVACPDWTLPSIARAAADWGYDGVELRTFGSASTQFACDPFLTSPEKVRAIMGGCGVQAAVLASGVSFEEPIRPPVIGFAISDTERTVRAAKECIDLAAQIEAPLVRVFGFEIPGREKRARAVRRIAERLSLCVDAARNTGVRLVLENGGSFATAPQVLEVLELVPSPLLGAAYSVAVARAAGEDPLEGIAAIGERLWVVKLKDRLENGRPCPLGDGIMAIPHVVGSLRDDGFDGWAVVEWDRAWIPGLEPAQEVLPEAVRRVHGWAAAAERPEPVSV
jgi:sugar phosphate isomerase/epimerase